MRISQAGMLNLAGYEKPLFYQRKALWTKAPFVRIAVGDGDKERHGVWNEHFRWDGQPGDKKIVSCYTNASEAELFLNGESLGRKQLTDEDGCRVSWEMDYQPGTLRAVVDGAEDTLSTLRPAVSIILSPDTHELQANGQDVAQVEIALLDEAGAPAADEIVHCQIIGDAQLLGIENGKPDDLTPYSESYRATLDGRAIAYIRAGRIAGPVTLYVWTASSLRAELSITLS